MAGEVKLLRFQDGDSVTAPSALPIDIGAVTGYADPAAYVTAKGSAAAAGDFFYNTTENALNYYDGTAWQTVVDITQGTAGTANAVPRFATDGRGLQDSGVTIDGSDNMTVPGDLTIQGTTTTIETTNLTVEDQNINVNRGGSDASAEGAGLNVERVGTDGSLIYEDALASKWKAGALAAEIELANVSSAQEMSNKTLGAYTKLKEQSVNLAGNTFISDGSTYAKLNAGAGPLITITNAQDLQFMVLANRLGADVVVQNSAIANSIITGTGEDIVLADNASIILIYRSSASQWYVIGGAGGSSWTTVKYDNTDDTTVLSNDQEILADTGTAAFGLVMPPITKSGQRVRIIDFAKNFNANNLTLTPDTGDTIDGDSSLVLDLERGHVELVSYWDGANGDWFVLALFAGGGGGAGQSWNYRTETTAYTAVADDWIWADTQTTGAFTITLPTGASDGDRVAVMDFQGSWSAAFLTVAPHSGGKIQGLAVDETLEIDQASLWAVFIYNAANNDWRIQGPLTEGSDDSLNQTMIFRDEKTSGTDGGGSVTGSFGTRDLNTTYNDQTWGSLSSNQITLTAGTYQVSGFTPAFAVGNHQCKLRNITDGSDALFGQSAYNAGPASVQTNSNIIGQFTIADTKTFELQHRSAVVKALNGFGANAGYGLEVYSTLAITKIRN